MSALKARSKFGTKAEVKNVNSFRFVRAALEYEIERQIEVIESGGRVIQESRLWNADEGRTYSMRSKEQAHDYRYFPEPDLPPLIVSAEFLAETRKKLPELPEARRARMIAEYELSPRDAATLTASREFADRFEAAARTARNPRRVANVLLSEVGGRLKALGLEQEQSPVSMAGIVQAADLLDEGKISSKQLKQLFDVCFEKGEDFAAVYDREKPEQITRRLGAGGVDRPDHRRQPQTGGAVPRRQDDPGWILCGPGDEGHQRPGQPRAAQRSGNEKAGGISAGLLQLQLTHIFLARIPRADGLGDAFLAVLFRPQFVIFRHIDLREAEMAFGVSGIAADATCSSSP